MPALPTPNFAFYHRLNPRERVLLLITAGAVLFILNLILLSVLLRNSRELNAQYTEKSRELEREQLFAAQKADLWQPRNNWLQKNQPVLVNRALAGPQLLEAVQSLARANVVVVTNPNIPAPPGATAGNPTGGNVDYQPVSVRVDTQSDWRGAIRFMAAVQKPESFLVFEQANLHADQADPNIMRGEFLISKWYTPAQK